MRLNVHPFTLKIAHYRPRVVCFVGKKIWDVYAAVCGKTATASASTRGQGTVEEADDASDGASVRIKTEEGSSTSPARKRLCRTESPGSPLVPIKKDPDAPPRIVAASSTATEPADAVQDVVKPFIAVGYTEVKVEDHDIDTSSSAPLPGTPSPLRPVNSSRTAYPRSKQPMDWHAPRPLRLPLPARYSNNTSGGRSEEQEYTYFWVTPSTSGLERTPVCLYITVVPSLSTLMSHHDPYTGCGERNELIGRWPS